jgi:hypothetical protein
MVNKQVMFVDVKCHLNFMITILADVMGQVFMLEL